jgi:site-specific recombinase XerD
MWIYQYDIAGRTRRITLGNVNAIGIDDARKIAGQLQSKVRLGKDPVREKAENREREALTFANVLKSFLEVQKRTTRASTWKTTNSLLGEHYCKSLHPLSLHAITRRDIANVLTPITACGMKGASNNVRSKLRAFFNWAIKQGLTENNPVHGTEKQEAKARARVLSMAELVAVWHTLGDMTNYSTIIHLKMLAGARRDEVPQMRSHDSVVDNMTNYSNIIRLLMLTGQRRAEISKLPWSETAPRKSSSMTDCPLLVPPLCSHRSGPRTNANTSCP